MKKIITSIIQLGISRKLPFHLQNKIRIYNTASLFISLIAFAYSCIGTVMHFYAVVSGTLLYEFVIRFIPHLKYKLEKGLEAWQTGLDRLDVILIIGIRA